jgi:hypothetical protein
MHLHRGLVRSLPRQRPAHNHVADHLQNTCACASADPRSQAHTISGSSIYAEQISHHPPVTSFHVEGPAGLFSFHGLSQPEVSFSGGGLKTSARGYRRITFASDGGVIEVRNWRSYCVLTYA